jgi:iron(III) transport system ATP-binding protein
MIRVSELSHVFDKRGIAGLHDLSFYLSAGKILGVMGPNGSGKTTLLQILGQRLIPHTGTVSLNGKTSIFPFSDSVDGQLNVLRFLTSSVTGEIEEEKKIQLARDLADTFEFTFQLRQSINQLSAGQLQKVLLASRLIDRPQVLLLDEPFTHLDPFTRRDILKGLFDYLKQQEITVVWVTHDLDESLRFSDTILLLNFGKMEQFSSPLEFMTRPRNLFVAQFMGYRNFFPVTLREGVWQSPWGKLNYSQLDKNEALLVVPDFAWEISETGPEFNILKRYPCRQFVEYELEYGNQRVYLTRSSGLSLFEENSGLSLRPLFDQSFLIPL